MGLCLGSGRDRHGAGAARTLARTCWVCDDLYGGTYRLFERVRRRTANLDFTYVNPSDLNAFRQGRSRPTTRMIWIETPSNPLLKLADLAAIGEVGPAVPTDITVVDNTFATPYVQRPVGFWFDIVVHSVTKYLNGHSDMIGGIAVVGQRRATWSNSSAFCKTRSVAVVRHISTALLEVRRQDARSAMERHCANALEIARWLDDATRRSNRSDYPGLEIASAARARPRNKCAGSAVWSRSF